MTLYAAGDPPLLLTHVPLLQVPPGAINVHGHVHEQESPRPNRHVNVSVEQTELPAGETERDPAAGPLPTPQPSARRGSMPPSRIDLLRQTVFTRLVTDVSGSGACRGQERRFLELQLRAPIWSQFQNAADQAACAEAVRLVQDRHPARSATSPSGLPPRPDDRSGDVVVSAPASKEATVAQRRRIGICTLYAPYTSRHGGNHDWMTPANA